MLMITLKQLIILLIIGLVTSLASLSFYHRFIHQELHIASIDFERLIQEQRDWLLDSGLENLEQLTIATYLNQRLSHLLTMNAVQKHTIFINKKVIVSGAPDWTEQALNIQGQQFEQALKALNEGNDETLAG